MARVSGIDLPRNKRGFIALTYIYGIGRTKALEILTKANVDPMKKVHEWNDDETSEIRNVITGEVKVEGALRSEVQLHIKRLMDIGSYRGIRHRKGLPVRGQRTSRKVRGKLLQIRKRPLNNK